MSSIGAGRSVEWPHKDITEKIIGAAIDVHRALGPGLLESAYEECLCHELNLTGLTFRRQVELPIRYKGVQLDCGYRVDLVVQEAVIVELKCVEKLLPIHDAQLLTYLRLSGIRVGLLMNFHTPALHQRNYQKGSLILCASVSLR